MSSNVDPRDYVQYPQAQPEKPEPDDNGAKFTPSHTEEESKRYDTPPQDLTPKNAGRKCRASKFAFCRFRKGRPETSPVKTGVRNIAQLQIICL